ncbi:39S ribosomal protein L12 mitochondrial [Biomphalaria pfeifferi]|uniref:Large ribosomal subunit protein bL12m n=1 Tax=Biomphalaria pfeifferi TaxID=112525 RepID=A0AAD8F0C6_BIOPF|nr:39S ribosomal protein L12 mitochondrial [Biomphalaria pfeifferi]
MRTACALIRHSQILNHCRRKLQSLASTKLVHVQNENSYSTSTEVLPPPPANIAMKTYSPKIEKLVSDIGQLTLLEVSDLNELLKKTLNIKEAPMMAMGSAPAAVAQKAPEEEEDVAPKREKVNFTVKLMKFDAGKKVQLIKEIKNLIEGLNLVQAKKFVESIPQIVKADIPKEEAEKLKEALTAAGAEIEIE